MTDREPLPSVTLRQAFDLRVVQSFRTLRGFRDAAGRYSKPAAKPKFPTPVSDGPTGRWYDVAALQLWEAELLHKRRVSRRSEPDPWVYFIVIGGMAELHYGAKCKIGYSENVKNRATQMMLRVEWIVHRERCDLPPEDADELPDKPWHRRFAAHALSGDVDEDREWFKVEGDLAAFLADRVPPEIGQRLRQEVSA